MNEIEELVFVLFENLHTFNHDEHADILAMYKKRLQYDDMHKQRMDTSVPIRPDDAKLVCQDDKVLTLIETIVRIERFEPEEIWNMIGFFLTAIHKFNRGERMDRLIVYKERLDSDYSIQQRMATSDLDVHKQFTYTYNFDHLCEGAFEIVSTFLEQERFKADDIIRSIKSFLDSIHSCNCKTRRIAATDGDKELRDFVRRANNAFKIAGTILHIERFQKDDIMVLYESLVYEMQKFAYIERHSDLATHKKFMCEQMP